MPMHKRILENIHALLDYNSVSKIKPERFTYFSKTFELTLQESENFLTGIEVPSPKLLKKIADKFEVDLPWILKN